MVSIWMAEFKYFLVIWWVSTAACLENAVSYENFTDINQWIFDPPKIEGLYEGTQENVHLLKSTYNIDFSISELTIADRKIVEIINFTQGANFITVKGLRLGRTQIAIKNASAIFNATHFIRAGTDYRIDKPEVLVYPVSVIRRNGWMDMTFIVVVSLVVVMANVAMGCKIDLDVVYEVLRRPFAPAIGFFCQFGVMPLTAYGLAIAFDLQGGPALGYFATGCSPGGGASNMYTYILGGDLSLSVTMTLISTLASFGMVPFWLYTLGQHFIDEKTQIKIPFQNIILSLAGIVIPVGIGVLIQRKKPDLAKKLIKFLKPLFVGLIVFLFTAGIYINSYLLQLIEPKLLCAAMLLPYIGYFTSGVLAAICKQPAYRIVTIIVETGIQNTGIPILLMKFSLPQPEADLSVIAPVLVATFTPFPLWIAIIVREIYKRRCANKKKQKFQQVCTDSGDELGPVDSPVLSELSDLETSDHENNSKKCVTA